MYTLKNAVSFIKSLSEKFIGWDVFQFLLSINFTK